MTAVQIAVLADDLTGAGDTAVQFVRAGWRTQLSIGGARQALDDSVSRRAQVLALTSHSRALSDEDAAAVVREEISLLRDAGVHRIYKKMDSTLRGAVRAEVEAARDAWGGDAIAVVCPAFPATGRTIEQGVLKVNGVPVSQTPVGGDLVTPVTQSHIPTLLNCTHIVPAPEETPSALARRLTQSGAVVSVDAKNETDLWRLAYAVAEMGERVVPVGSGGLADPLARVWASEQARGAIVVLVTSQHETSRQQAAYLSKLGVQTWCPDPAPLVDPQSWAVWCSDVLAAQSARDGGETVVLLAPKSRRSDLSAGDLARRLGALAADLVRQVKAGGVVVTGGDGAYYVLEALGATGIALLDEVVGGVPLGTLTGGDCSGLPVVTKAGGFGAENALAMAVRAIRERIFEHNDANA